MFNKLTLTLLALIPISFFVGKYTTKPQMVTKVETQIVEKEVVKYKEVTNKDIKKNSEVTIIETKNPDGTIKKETKIVDKGTETNNKTLESSQESAKISNTKTSTSESNWHIGVFVKPNEYKDLGIGIERRILGPFYLGVGYIDQRGQFILSGSF